MNRTAFVLCVIFAVVNAGVHPTAYSQDKPTPSIDSVLRGLDTEIPSPTLHYLFETTSREYEGLRLKATAGIIPNWLVGTMYHNGFGKFGGKSPKGDWRFPYLFDVLSMVYKWDFDGDSMEFTNKFLTGNTFNTSLTDYPAMRTFAGYDPAPGIVHDAKTLAGVRFTDSLNVNIIDIPSAEASHLFAISDVSGEVEIDVKTMRTMGQYQFENDPLNSVLHIMTTAHPSRLAGDNFTYRYVVALFENVLHNPIKPHNYVLYRYNHENSGPLKREVVAKIPISHVPYVHSFGHTQNYVVLVEFPLFWNIAGIVSKTTIYDNLQWKPERRTRILVVDKHSGEVVKTAYASPFFAYHHINAFERNDIDGTTEVVMDISAYRDNTHMEIFSLGPDHLDNTFPVPEGFLKRLVVPIHKTKKIEEITHNVNSELPQINTKYLGKKHKYVYSLSSTPKGSWWNAILKINTDEGRIMETFHRKDEYPTEPLFVARPGATSEDDGVILTVVLGAKRYGSSYVAILDAKNLEVIGEIKLPIFVPFLSHGNFYDKAK